MTEGRILLSEVYNYVYWLKCNQLCSVNVVFVTVCLFACACKHTGSFSNHRNPRKVQILVTTTHYASVPHVPDYVHLCFLTAFSLSCSIK